MTASQFRPQLTRDEAITLAGRYDAPADEPAMQAGRKIREGDYSRTNLETIYKWKTKDRGKSRLTHNTDEQISDALWLASIAKEPRSAMALLTGLYGVDTPVGSAVATAMHPDTHTILDFRALQALGSQSADRSIPFYLEYLAFCIALAHDWRLPLRHLDRALWQWSADQA